MGVRGRLIVITTVVLGITVLVSLALALRLEDEDQRSSTTEGVEAVVAALADTAAAAVDRDGDASPAIDAAVAAIERRGPRFGIAHLYVLDKDGVDLAHASSPRLDRYLRSVLTDDGALADPPPPAWPKRIAAPFFAHGRRYVVVSVVDVGNMRLEIVERAQRFGATNVLVTLLGVLVLLLLLSVEVLAPLRRLSALAARLGTGADVDVVDEVGGGRELRQLAEVLANASDRLHVQREQLETAVSVRTQELAQANAALSSMNERLQQLALTDPLTGLLNRRALEQVLAHEVNRHKRTQQPYALLMLDVDHFKNLNDTCGHATGDEVLRGLARVVRGALRASDVVARVGGEEFVVLLLDNDSADAAIAAEKLRVAVRDAQLPGSGHQPLGRVTISVGVASAPADGVDADVVLAAADSALYAAKRGGRDRVVVAESAQRTTSS